MTTVITTGTVAFAAPAEYRKTGNCPHCGAPIYADASLTKGKNGEVLTVLPQPHYTCTCRFILQPQVIPAPAPVPWPIPITPPWTPWPGGGTGDAPYPWPTIICKPSDTQCKTPRNPLGNTIPSGPQCDFDWKQFCGSGGITATPFKGVVLY